MLKSLWLFSFLAASASLHAAPSLLSLPHEAATLPNGLRVFLVKYPSPGVVAYQLPVRAGSRNEVEKGKSGFAHFFEHLMFRGTKKMSGKQFGELYARLGAENNAWTWFDMTNYHGVVATAYLDRILAAEADRFANLRFSEKALKDEAGAVVGEYNKSISSPEFVLEEKLLATAFTTHPYGHTTMGYKEDILNFTERYKDVWPFFRRYYRPSNIAVVLVGDVDFKKTQALVKSKFGGWKDPKVDKVEIPREPAQTAPRSVTVKLDRPAQTRIAVAYKVPAFSTKKVDSAVIDLIAEMTFSTTSEFQKTYRFDRKWVDAVDAAVLPTVDPGLWTINVRLSEAGEGKRDEVLKAIEKTVAGVRESAPSKERLAATKNRFRNAALTSWFSRPDSLASQIAWYTNFEDDLGVLDRHFARLEEATARDIQGFAERYLVDNGKTVAVLQGGGK